MASTHRHVIRLTALVPVLLCGACPLPGQLADKLPSEGDEERDPLAVVAPFEDALFDVLECQDIARPSTLERVRDVLHEPTSDEVQALLLNPADLATVVAKGGVQVEVAVIVLQNLYRIATNGVLADVLQNGWDGVSCEEPVTVSCTAGTQTTTVSCDGDNAVQAIALAFDDCVVDGTLRQGGLSLARDASDSTRAVLGFDGLTLDEVERFEGALSVAVATGAPRLDASAGAAEGFALVSHGGVDSDVSCGEETRVDVAHLVVTDADAFLELAARKVDAQDTLAVQTFGEHLAFGDFSGFSSCRCPDVGSGLEIDVPRPLGREGEVARARISWDESGDADHCREVSVILNGWPSACAPLSATRPDCARVATADALRALFRALCAP